MHLSTARLHVEGYKDAFFPASHEIAGSKRYDNFKKSHHLWNVEHMTKLLDEVQVHGEADVHDVASPPTQF